MAESRFVEANGLRFHVMDWGGNRERLLVCLHGLASRCHMADLIADHFTDHFHVYAPDQRGHGLSDKPSTGYDFETIAGDLDGLLAALNPDGAPVYLMGHSWGGYTTLYYAATRPHVPTKAVLLDGGLWRTADDFATWEEAEKGMAPPVYQNRSLEDIRRMIVQDWLGPIYRPELVPLLFTVFDASDPQNVKAYLGRENHMKIARALWEFDSRDYFPRVTCPALIVNAIPPGQSRTPRREEYARRAQEGIAHCRIEWMDDTHHDIPWHRPSELAAILDTFLP